MSTRIELAARFLSHACTTYIPHPDNAAEAVRHALTLADALLASEPAQTYGGIKLCEKCRAPEKRCLCEAPQLPVPGKGECPEWAKWIAWTFGVAYVSDRPPTMNDDGSITHRRGRSMLLPAYDDPSRAGQCIALEAGKDAAVTWVLTKKGRLVVFECSTRDTHGWQFAASDGEIERALLDLLGNKSRVELDVRLKE